MTRVVCLQLLLCCLIVFFPFSVMCSAPDMADGDAGEATEDDISEGCIGNVVMLIYMVHFLMIER